MYAQFFGLTQAPFSIAPDPRYLFMSERHREALAHLLYGLEGGGGFVLLSGEIGAGKTTVCRCFLEQIPANCNVAYIFNPKLTTVELMQSVCEEFRVPGTPAAAGATVKDYLDPLNQFLLATHAAGQNNVLIIDEAQNLSADVLEQLRLLTNLETNERKLLQIILIGQPELRSMLARPELEQLAQRVIARFHLEPLSDAETDQYVRHRLSIAGLQGAIPFDARAMQRIHQLARGVPRRINLICDRALLGAYATSTHVVNRGIVDKAAAEVFFTPEHASKSGGMPSRVALVLVGLAVGAALFGVVQGLANRRAHGVASSASAPASNAAAALAATSASGARATVWADSRRSNAPGGIAAQIASAPVAGRPPPTGAAEAMTAAELAAASGGHSHQEGDAWRALAPAWKLQLPEGDPCLAAQRLGTPCFRSSGSSLALIRQLDRPGIVTLRDADDKPVYAVLTGLSSRSATLRIAGVPRVVALPSLAALWRGDFATFWRAPPGYTGGLVDGGSGTATDWLIQQLDRLQPAEAGQALRARVYTFQLAQGLKPDGLAGPTTFMQLNRAIGIDEPHLAADAPPN